MITREEYNRALKIIKEYRTQLDNHYQEVNNDFNSLNKFYDVNKETRIVDTDCSVRTLNIIKMMDIDKISDFSTISISDMKKHKNFGKKTLEEVKEMCFYAGVDLK